MKIRNTSNKVIGVSNGVYLLPDTTVTVNDNLADNVTIKVLVERGMLSIVEEPKKAEKKEKKPEYVPVEIEVVEEPAPEAEAEPEKPKRTRKKKTETAE